MRIIGKQVQDQAKQLGLTNQPQYTFYGRPRKIKANFSKIKPDFAYILEDWMISLDPSTTTSESVIIKSFNAQWDDGIVPHLNLKKLEKKYKVKGEDIVNAWNSFL